MLRPAFFYLAIAALIALPLPSLAEKEFSCGASEASQFIDARVVQSPPPVIPSELHEHCFKSCCLARFIIQPDGKAQVTLLSSSGSPDIDEITMATLRRWKFKPAVLNGKPVQSTRRVKVEFEVE